MIVDVLQLMNSNPEMAHILNNPQLLRESLALATNPALMREQMRHSDRAMSNLEAHPEGFNALRRMYENVQASHLDLPCVIESLAAHEQNCHSAAKRWTCWASSQLFSDQMHESL